MDKLILNNDIATKLLRKYNLDLVSYTPIIAGIENTSAFVLTNEGRFVIRVYRQNNNPLKWVRIELKFMSFLRSTGVPIPEVKKNAKGSLLSSYKEGKKTWRYILLELVSGRHLKAIDYKLIPSLARFQAKMHKEALNFSAENTIPKNYLKNLLNFFGPAEKNTKTKLKNEKFWSDAKEITDEISVNFKSNLDTLERLPHGLVHLDYDSDNIIVNKGKIAGIIDFGDISNLPFVVDLANTLWWWAYMNRTKDYTKILKTYLMHYQTERPLSKAELSFIPIFMRLRNIAVGIVFEAGRVRQASPKESLRIINFDKVLWNSAKKPMLLI